MTLWVANRLENVAQAYQTITTPLYYTPDGRLPNGYVSYSSPYKQWLYDSGVSGALVINSISGGAFSAPLTRASGLHIDYNNGRVILPASFGTALKLTGSYSLKEINVYLPIEQDDPLLSATKYFRNPRYSQVPTSGISPSALCTPAVFVNTLFDTSAPFAFGGFEETKTTFTLTALVDSDYQLKAVLSLFRDAARSYIPLLNIAQDPLDQFGDLKGGTGYNYQALVEQYGTPGNLIYIDRVSASKVSDNVNLSPGVFAGVIDLDLSFVRLPR